MMPVWLPRELVLNGPRVQDDYKKLYGVFYRYFVARGLPTVDGDLVIYNTTPNPNYDDERFVYGFTHLVTKDADSEGGVRSIDYFRAERLPWVRAIIDNYEQEEVRAFWARGVDGKVKLYLWLFDYDFVVIMERIGDGSRNMMLTAYRVYSNRRRHFQRLYEHAVKVL